MSYNKNNSQKSNKNMNRSNNSCKGSGRNARYDKRAYKDKEFIQETERIQGNKKVENDSAFYYTDENYIRPFASIPFNNIVGLETPAYKSNIYKSSGEEAYGVTGLPSGHTVPGILVIDFIPFVGYSDSPTSALNVSSQKNYAFVRHENSGSANYDAPNMMQYSMAVLGLMPAIEHVRRAIKSIGLYSAVNRYSPDTLIEAMGFDPADLRKNLASYIGQFNLMISRFNKFAIPAGFKHLMRWHFLSSNIFSDRDSPKGQLYLFRPMGVPRWVEITGPDTLPEVQMTQPVYGLRNHDTLQKSLDQINASLDQLYQSDIIGIISGDIMKAYGVDNLYKLDIITTPAIDISYSKTALEQIQNLQTVPWLSFASAAGHNVVSIPATSAAGPIPTAVDNLWQTVTCKEIVNEEDATSYIACTPYIRSDAESGTEQFNSIGISSYLGSATLMNSTNPVPTVEDVVEITRSKTLCSGIMIPDELAACGIKGCMLDAGCTELYTTFSIYDASLSRSYMLSSFWATNIATESEKAQIAQALRMLSAFDWSPTIYDVILDPGYSQVQANTLMCETDNSVYVQSSDVQQLNKAILQSVFGVL